MANPQTEGRMLRKSIADSDDFSKLSPEAAVLFCMIIPHLNSHGKLQGGPAFIKEIVCPKIPYILMENIPVLMSEISANTDIKWFEYDSRYWIHALHFTDHQKLPPNKIGKNTLPDYIKESPAVNNLSPELVQSKSITSPELVPHEVEEEVKVEVEEERGADAPFEIPSKEIIQEASDPMVLSQIEEICGQLYTEKIFPEVNAFKNKMLKAKKNPRSVLHTLCRAYMKRTFEEGPWAYCQKIIENESQNYNARDYQKTAQKNLR